MVLIKIGSNENSRIYLDYPTPREAVAGILAFYEQLLRQKNAGQPSLAYSIGDLFTFLDTLAELVMLMYTLSATKDRFDPTDKVFRPHGRDFIKAMILSEHSQGA